jgi:hypothetical protein
MGPLEHGPHRGALRVERPLLSSSPSEKKKSSINCSGNIIFSVVDKILYFSYWKNGESIGSYVDLESQMMMAEGSLDMLLFGLNVTRYFSQGENSMNWHTKKRN